MTQYEMLAHVLHGITMLTVVLSVGPGMLGFLLFETEEVKFWSFRGAQVIVLILMLVVGVFFASVYLDRRITASYEGRQEFQQEIEQNSAVLERYLLKEPVTKFEMWWVKLDGSLADSRQLKYYRDVLCKYIVPEKEIGQAYPFDEYCKKQVYPVLGAYESFKRMP